MCVCVLRHGRCLVEISERQACRVIWLAFCVYFRQEVRHRYRWLAIHDCGCNDDVFAIVGRGARRQHFFRYGLQSFISSKSTPNGYIRKSAALFATVNSSKEREVAVISSLLSVYQLFTKVARDLGIFCNSPPKVAPENQPHKRHQKIEHHHSCLIMLIFGSKAQFSTPRTIYATQIFFSTPPSS